MTNPQQNNGAAGGDAWPPLASQNRPWTRWWWMGGAPHDEAEVTRQLAAFRDAGIGGVEVSPIYGPRGAEGRYVPFLSPRWVELFGHTLAEAERLGLGVDLIAGTGWPFGGPWVAEGDAARVAWVESFSAAEDVRHKRKTEQWVETLAVSEGAGGRRYALFLSHTGQQVKRAAPGGEGDVLDHFDAEAVRRYLETFDRAFAALPAGRRPRCFFNDSWEVFGANATTDILAEFEKRRGYDLRPHLAVLKGDGDLDTVTRVRSDYRQTVHDLTLEAFVAPFGAWAHHAHGAKMRNQAHGSPGNLLDLYAAADVPETEVFGPVRIEKSGLERLTEGLPPDFGHEEEALVCRFASSAAHVAGRPLCSSESFTWAGEHGHVPPEHLKAEADLLFTLGINHLFFHGTPQSPGDAPWPGNLFYATTHLAPTNPLWRDLPALNAYIARCQSLLQAGSPDSDVLLYFPFFDLLAGEEGAKDLLQFLSVHKSATWLRGNLPGFVRAANGLAARGYAFDMVSDRQLAADVKAEGDGRLAAQGGATYETLLVAHCRRMPPETLERIAELAEAGATVLFAGGLPEDVPGLADLEARRARLRAARERLAGNARVRTGPEPGKLLEAAGVPREAMADRGLEFVRRRTEDGKRRVWFVSNPGKEDVRGRVPLAHLSPSVTLLDPMTGAVGAAAVGDGGVYLDLPAGASLLLRTGDPAAAPEWPYHEAAGEGTLLAQGWRVEFLEGGPTLPAAREVPALSDWTTWGDAAVSDFSGTARYTLSFDAPAGDADAWSLELGRVCHSARVRLNGRDLGTVLARPWRVTVPGELLKPAGNTLEVEVTNLMANRLAALEREKGAGWRPFLMVNIHYKPFDAASTWAPVPSGLVGPVRLVPLRRRAHDSLR